MPWMTMTNNEIEFAVLDIFSKYIPRGNSHKQLFKIMQNEGIKFREVASTNAKFVGAITFGEDNQPYIMVNQGIDNIGRRNFTIAHELGHYFLNHKLHSSSFFCQDNQISEESEVTNKIEHEANYFASCFLMPRQKIISAFYAIIRRSNKATTRNFLLVNNKTFGVWCGIRDSFMERYGVSQAALRYRLIGLQLVKFEFNT